MSNRGAASTATVNRNDWGSLVPPELPGWMPSLSVTVVVTDVRDQEQLNRTLAAICYQTYPPYLFDVIVTEGESHSFIELPPLRPERCQVVPAAEGAPFPSAVAASSADVIIRMPAGAVVAPEFVAALVRWHHVAPDAVSIAPLDHASAADDASAEEVAEWCASGTITELFPTNPPTTELTRLLDESHQLRSADHLAFLAVAGVPFAFRRDRYQSGSDRYEGADIEVGYRLAQAGAVFLPEPLARGCQTGPAPASPDFTRRQAELVDLMPYPRTSRTATGRSWGVPLVTALVPVEGAYEMVRACVDRLLGSTETDLRVLLVADWDGRLTRDPDNSELRLLAAEYRSELRVQMVHSAPKTVFPSPYLLRVPSRLGVGPDTVHTLVTAAEQWQAGLLRVLPAAASSANYAVELWQSAALARALRTGASAAELPAVVSRSHGERWETGSDFDVVDLTTPISAPAVIQKPTAAPRRRAPETIAVGGARSLAKATAFVTRRYAQAARRRIVRR